MVIFAKLKYNLETNPAVYDSLTLFYIYSSSPFAASTVSLAANR